MKYYISAAILIVGVVVLAKTIFGGPVQDPVGVMVSTNSTIILSPRSLGEGFEATDAVTFVAEASATAGTILQITNTTAFYLVTGTNGVLGATAPTHDSGSAVNGTITLKRIENGRRKGLAVVNNSSGSIYIAIGKPAAVNTGIYLVANGGSWVSDGVGCPQAYISACAPLGATNLVTAIEW